VQKQKLSTTATHVPSPPRCSTTNSQSSVVTDTNPARLTAKQNAKPDSLTLDMSSTNNSTRVEILNLSTMEPLTAQMSDVTFVWLCIIVLTLTIGFVATITKNS